MTRTTNVTGTLLGDPPPGRTPWAAPSAPDEAPRTGLSPTTTTLAPPEPQFSTPAEIRPGEDDGRKRRQSRTPDRYDSEPAEIADKHAAKPDSAAPRDRFDPPPETLRPVAPVQFSGETSAIPTPAPQMEWMAPADLLIEGRYQRDLSEASRRQIARIVANWDWRKFKPPIVAWTERGFEIIDGQHTAIAAATHPEIEKIPVLVVEAPQVEDRAAAFIGHNRDHLAVTPLQLHFAAVAAGDPDAIDVQNVISRSGAKLLATQYGGQRFRAGETVAVSAVRSLVGKRGVQKARQVLELLVKAEQGPITAVQIKATDMLLHRPEYAEADFDFLPGTIRDAGPEVDREAKVDAKTYQIPVYEALGRIWFRKCRKQRRVA
jgi:hypothetical protein